MPRHVHIGIWNPDQRFEVRIYPELSLLWMVWIIKELREEGDYVE